MGLSSLLIIYLYIMHKHLRTLFFNTFVILVSLGALQFIVLVVPMPCFWEGLLMYYILTFNNCITIFIIWLLYAFVRYGQQIERPIDDESHSEIELAGNQILSTPKSTQLNPVKATSQQSSTKIGLG